MIPFCMTLIVLLVFAAIVVLGRQLWLDYRVGAAGIPVQDLYEQHRAGLEAMSREERQQ